MYACMSVKDSSRVCLVGHMLDIEREGLPETLRMP